MRTKVWLVVGILLAVVAVGGYIYGATHVQFMWDNLGGKQLYYAYAKVADPKPPTDFYIQVGYSGTSDAKCYHVKFTTSVSSPTPWRDQEMELDEEFGGNCGERIYDELPVVQMREAPSVGIAELTK